jgi:glycosyltransferase involved in cell wall biosynthesis
MRPLISVIMPAFNAADTILFALASLQAQTCGDWECIIVDDGSTDGSEQSVQAVCDARLRFHRLDRNQGRGYARQYGLTLAQGKYVAFLDADDWIYPNKLRDQLQLLEDEPEVAVVSAGMAIVDTNDHLVGLRSAQPNAQVIHDPLKRIAMPPLAFAPSMIVASLAQATGFDPTFPIAEDADFLLRVMFGRPYAILPTPFYVYREHASATLAKVGASLDYCCTMFAKHLNQHPFGSAVEIAKARAKQMIYRSGSALGLWQHMIRRRSRTPDIADRKQYEQAWQVVSKIEASYSCPCVESPLH